MSMLKPSVGNTSPEFLAEDIGPTIIATASLMIVFCTLFVALRYYARYLTSTSFGAEDVIIPLAWLAEMGLCATGIVMVKKADTGRHMDFILQTDPAKITEHFKGIMINEVLHLPAVAFPKLCVVLLFLRVFTNKWERRAAWTLVALILATWFSFTIAALFQCRPFAYNWDKTIPGGKCFNVVAFSYSSSVPNIVTDVAVLFLPIRTVFDLKISLGRRIGLFLIFLTGSVGIIASIIRTVVFVTTDPLIDVTYNHTALVNWTIIEPGMYLLAACALSYKPLFRMVAKALHLSHLLTVTKSLARTGTRTHKTQVTQKEIHMETFKSESSGGFTKLSDETDGGDEEEGKGERGIRVTVTKTIETESETQSVDWEELYTEAKLEEIRREAGRAM